MTSMDYLYWSFIPIYLIFPALLKILLDIAELHLVDNHGEVDKRKKSEKKTTT